MTLPRKYDCPTRVTVLIKMYTCMYIKGLQYVSYPIFPISLTAHKIINIHYRNKIDGIQLLSFKKRKKSVANDNDVGRASNHVTRQQKKLFLLTHKWMEANKKKSLLCRIGVLTGK